MNNDKAWCETCKEDTYYRKVSEVGPYCLLERNCCNCGIEMYDRAEPITDGSQDIVYLCFNCAEKSKRYINILERPTENNIAPASPMTDELWAEFSKPREENNEKE